ncbi:MAG: hypothetical protein GY928_33610 [Colwellia sp.]|nr:hypothetical protein [Colwellia sp.]
MTVLGFVLSTEFEGKRYFWCGGGRFTLDPNKAKDYPTWQQAERWCKQIKRWDMGYSHIEDELDKIAQKEHELTEAIKQQTGLPPKFKNGAKVAWATKSNTFMGTVTGSGKLANFSIVLVESATKRTKDIGRQVTVHNDYLGDISSGSTEVQKRPY